jgi:hypothetical protein
VRSSLYWGIPLLLATSLGAGYDYYASAKEKVDLIVSDRLQSGARVQLSLPELLAYAQREAPPGVRNPKIQVTAPGVMTGSALIDFGKVRRAQGYQPGKLMAMLLDGERPVTVTAALQSAGGKATVTAQRVEISGVEIDGKMLDFLIRNFVLPLYPNAMVDRPFEMSHRIDRLEVEPSGVRVFIGR